jgi:hypothetical protein
MRYEIKIKVIVDGLTPDEIKAICLVALDGGGASRDIAVTHIEVRPAWSLTGESACPSTT